MTGDDLASDHDLLIMLMQQINDIKRTLDSISPILRSLDSRMGEIEENSARHSERLTRLRSDVESLKQDKLNRQEIEAIKDDVSSLKVKSNAWDFINSAAIAVVTVLELIFKSR